MDNLSTVFPASEKNLPTPPGSRVSIIVATFGSLLIHVFIFFSLASLTSLPSVGFRIELPSEVEFGLTEGTKMETPRGNESLDTPEPVSTAAPVDHEPKRATASLETVDLEKKRKTREKRDDAGIERAKKEEKTEDGGFDERFGQSDSGTSVLAAYAPPGTQLALRLDVERVRVSPLAADVRKLLDVVPDWKLILEGSGIDPIADLKRLFIASPNLLRSRLVIAGQYQGGQKLAQKAVANLAATQGREASWHTENGIAVAPWLNRDETERIIALVGPEMFAITRPSDLPRVLAVAKGLAERRAQEKSKERDFASALLATEAGETLSLSVEGARQFVRGRTEGVPSRISVSVKEEEEERIVVTAEGFYDSAEQAQQAKAYWEKIRKRAMSHPLVALVDMDQPLANATIELDDTRLMARTVLTYRHIRVLLGVVESALSTPETTPLPVYDNKPHSPTTQNQKNSLPVYENKPHSPTTQNQKNIPKR